jgi:hypothetical protein
MFGRSTIYSKIDCEFAKGKVRFFLQYQYVKKVIPKIIFYIYMVSTKPKLFFAHFSSNVPVIWKVLGSYVFYLRETKKTICYKVKEMNQRES